MNSSDDEGGLKRTLQLPPDSSDDDTELVKSSALQSIELKIEVSNITARTAVKGGGKIELVQFIDKGLILELPEKSCAVGHHLEGEIKTSGLPNQELQLRFTAKVELVENQEDKNSSDKRSRVSLRFIQFSEEIWEQLRTSLQGRQEEIEKFLTASKG